MSSKKTKIEWTDMTVNPIHLVREDGSHGGHWCRKISPGCANCYAEGQNQSSFFKFASHLKYSGKPPDNLILDLKVMTDLIKVRPKKIFVCSMTDLFGDWIPEEWLHKVFGAMAITKQHTFQVLTKRPERMYKLLQQGGKQFIRRAAVDIGRELNLAPAIYESFETCEWDWPLPNVWLGVSVENQQARDRIPLLEKTPAAIRFLSCEPMLEATDLREHLGLCVGCQSCGFVGGHRIGKSRIDWVICGGESGVGARPCAIEWMQSLVEQCKESRTKIFVKQLGCNPVFESRSPENPGFRKFPKTDRTGLQLDDYPPALRVREFPE